MSAVTSPVTSPSIVSPYISYSEMEQPKQQPFNEHHSPISPKLVVHIQPIASSSTPLPPKRSASPDINEMTIEELKKDLLDTKIRLKELQVKSNKYKLLLQKDHDEKEAIVQKLKESLGLTVEMFHSTNGEIKDSCVQLTKQRDLIFKEIQKFEKSHKIKTIQPVLKKAYDIQLASLQKEITASQKLVTKLNNERDNIIEEMVLLNTKNAELNNMNNDLSRHIASRESEVHALMAGTYFMNKNNKHQQHKHQQHHHHQRYGSSEITSESSSTTNPSISTPASPNFTIEPSISTSSYKDVNRESRRASANNLPSSKQINLLPQPTRPNSSDFKKSTKSMFAGLQTTMNKKKEDNNNNNKEKEDNNEEDNNKLKDLIDEDKRQLFQQQQRQALLTMEKIKSIGHHQFAETKFLRPTKCEMCHEKMWRTSELKCQACSMVCHCKCATYIVDHCKNASALHVKLPTKGQKSMFGTDLAIQVKSENRQIPFIVQSCIEAVESRGLDMEGIYRKSGGSSQMKLIQQSFDNNENTDLTDTAKWSDLCAITSVLKQYFRSLPNPLFPFEFYQPMMKAIDCHDMNERIDQLRNVLSTMPKENYMTIRYLMEHLERVQNRSQYNLMVPKNIATVFAPSLIRHPDEMRDIAEMNHKIHVMSFILQYRKELFDTLPPLPPKTPTR
ncbi:unnamed protein product [Cunninghamella blakesleeana]